MSGNNRNQREVEHQIVQQASLPWMRATLTSMPQFRVEQHLPDQFEDMLQRVDQAELAAGRN